MKSPLFMAAALVALVVAPGVTAQDTTTVVPPPATPPGGSPARTSWTSDRLALRAGDIVTILIDEYTQVSADRNEAASREKDRNVALNGGASSSTFGGSLRTGNDVSNRNRGESSRRERFVAEMSTRVVEIGPGGLLRVEGTKKVQVDKHEQEVTVRGWIRPQDVSSDNTVESWRVAEAEILYSSNGELVKAGGLWSKLLDLILP